MTGWAGDNEYNKNGDLMQKKLAAKGIKKALFFKIHYLVLKLEGSPFFPQ
jgi:hypothetical protein